MLTTETRGNRQKPPTGTNKPPNARRTSNFVTDFDANDTREEDQEKVMDRVSPHVACCLCCSGSRKLASCPNYKKSRSANAIGYVIFVSNQDFIEAGVNSKSSYIM